MIRHPAIEAEPAEPPVCARFRVDFVAEPALGADARQVSDQQHPHDQLRID